MVRTMPVTACVLIALWLMAAPLAWSQPAPPAEAPPPEVEATPEPAPEPAAQPAAAPSAPERYVERGREYPAVVGQFVSDHPGSAVAFYLGEKLATPLLFAVLLLVVGLGAQHLLDRLVRDLERSRVAMSRTRSSDDGARWWPYSAMALLAWAFALGVASEAVGLSWVTELMKATVTLVGALLTAAVWLVVFVAAAGLIAFAVSGRGREIVL